VQIGKFLNVVQHFRLLTSDSVQWSLLVLLTPKFLRKKWTPTLLFHRPPTSFRKTEPLVGVDNKLAYVLYSFLFTTVIVEKSTITDKQDGEKRNNKQT